MSGSGCMDVSAPDNDVSPFGDVIYAYTRAQAIEDGTLVNVTEMAKEAGKKYPTAVTEALWNGYIEPTEQLKDQGQSMQGRLWDVLFLFTLAAKTSPKGCSELFYKVNFLMENGDSCKLETVTIKAVCRPGDDSAPCITLMLLNEVSEALGNKDPSNWESDPWLYEILGDSWKYMVNRIRKEDVDILEE